MLFTIKKFLIQEIKPLSNLLQILYKISAEIKLNLYPMIYMEFQILIILLIKRI